MNSDYVAGFFDGEGSFSIFVRNDERYRTGFHVSLRINMTQKNGIVLNHIKNFLRMGNITFNKSHELYEYNITRIKDVKKFVDLTNDKLIVKKDELDTFKKCVDIMIDKRHLKKQGLNHAIKLKCMLRPRN